MHQLWFLKAHFGNLARIEFWQGFFIKKKIVCKLPATLHFCEFIVSNVFKL